jgi:hypothetical protein
LLALLISSGVAGEGAAGTKPPLPRPKPEEVVLEQLRRDLMSPLYEPSLIPEFQPLDIDHHVVNKAGKGQLLLDPGELDKIWLGKQELYNLTR